MMMTAPSCVRKAIVSALAGFMLSLGSGACADIVVAQQDLYLDALKSLSEGRHTDASEALIRMIEREPQHAGAWLDLAIIQCELGRGAEAEKLFEVIESRFSPPPVIREVIAAQRAKGCKSWQPQSRKSFVVGRGTDSNVNQGASNPNFIIGTGTTQVELQLLPEHLPQSDQYTMLTGDYLRELTPNGTLGFLQARVMHNDSLARYNTASLIVGAEHPWRFGDWGMRGTGLVAMHALGGKLYQSQQQVQLRASPPLNLPRGLEFSVAGGLSRIEYLTLDNYDSTISDLRGLLTYRHGETQMQANIGYLNDHGMSARPGGDRAGWFTSFYGRTRLSSLVLGEFSWTRQTWLSESPYSLLIDRVRNQKTQVMRGALIFPVTENQSIQLEVRKVKNDENISVFQYGSRQIQVSWQWRD
ncbi:tetratricopeptide repeat protein [Noviherbaspirillum malthae]|jgi:hypothetical protein|uniref:tetratricopeptide repeat protein n=1 Tax=Noviherbaspirillum malthae TaxID=1260987 RepID=UPI001E3C4515|nr:tetratricopeptide repeat protein [Noviherbaspirillum malthae]